MVPVRAGYAVFYAEALQHMQKEPVAQNGSFYLIYLQFFALYKLQHSITHSMWCRMLSYGMKEAIKQIILYRQSPLM